MTTLSWAATPSAIKAAGIAAVLGFFVSCSSTVRTNTAAGSTCSHTDVGALVAGVTAVVCGVIGVALCARRTQPDRSLLLAVSIGAVALGVVHVLRGLSVVGGPCN
ncbi:MAG: hypothetical protein AAFP84_01330 [Actinomycetota bacterium]